MDDKSLKNILRNTNVNFYLGAGASVSSTHKGISYPLMGDLLILIKTTIKEYEINDFGRYETFILEIFKMLEDDSCNIEDFLTKLVSFSTYINEEKYNSRFNEFTNLILDKIVERIKKSDNSHIIVIYKKFYTALKFLYSNYKNPINIFTTNYDLLNEEALDLIGLHYYSGFHGTVHRQFIPQFYDSDYVDYFSVNGTNFQVNQQHINLYKLHGSLSWRLKNISGKEIVVEDIHDFKSPVIIYPTINKYNDSNQMVTFTTLQRLFSQKLSIRRSTLIVIGSSLSDEHINKIIENSLIDKTFHLILFPYDIKQRTSFEKKFSLNKNVLIYDTDGITLETFSELINPNNGVVFEDDNKD